MANYPFQNYQQPGFNPYIQQPYANPQWQQQGVQQPVQTVPMSGSIAAAPISQPGFVCRPVASKAEAQAVPTDFSGNMLVMTDIANGAIYTKALDPSTGSAQFVTYQRVIDAQKPSEQTVFSANMTDFSATFNTFGEQLSRMSGRIDELFEKLDVKSKVVSKNAKPTE